MSDTSSPNSATPSTDTTMKSSANPDTTDGGMWSPAGPPPEPINEPATAPPPASVLTPHVATPVAPTPAPTIPPPGEPVGSYPPYRGPMPSEYVPSGYVPPSPNDPSLPPGVAPPGMSGAGAPSGTPRTPNPQFEAAKDTAAAMFSEVKSAVSGASKREPYPLFAVASFAFTTVWMLWPENDKIGAQRLKLWTVFVVASVALVFVPMVRKLLRLDDTRAWQIGVGGACGLGFAWVAFLLPRIDSNQAFFGTLAAAAAGLAAWTAPGRPD